MTARKTMNITPITKSRSDRGDIGGRVTLEYRDLEPLISLYNDIQRAHTTLIVDKDLHGILNRIRESLNRIEPINAENDRSIWLEVIAPLQCERGDDADENGCYWVRLVCGYKDSRNYLHLHNGLWTYFCISSSDDYRKSDNLKRKYHSIVNSLLKLERYINSVVDRICENPDEYKTDIENRLPYFKRKGKIKRSVYYSIFPEARDKQFNVSADEIRHAIQRSEEIPVSVFPKMTLRIYMHIWRKVYEAFYWAEEGKELHYAFSDEELFLSRNNVGHMMMENGKYNNKYNLDSEEDYKKWHHDMEGYHCDGIAYIGMVLYACEKAGYNDYFDEPILNTIPAANWYFYLVARQCYYNELIGVVKILAEQGIRLVTPDISVITKMVDGADCIGIVQSPVRYHQVQGVTEEIPFPFVGENVTEEQQKALIMAAEWEMIDSP